MWHTKPKIFTVLPFTEKKVCCSFFSTLTISIYYYQKVSHPLKCKFLENRNLRIVLTSVSCRLAWCMQHSTSSEKAYFIDLHTEHGGR